MQTVEAGPGCKQVSHLQTAQPSERHFFIQHNVAGTAAWLLSHESLVLSSQQSTPQCHKAARAQLTWRCHRTRTINPQSAASLRSSPEAQISPGMHRQKRFPCELNPTKGHKTGGNSFRERKPANKADAALCWCGTPIAVIPWPEQWVRASSATGDCRLEPNGRVAAGVTVIGLMWLP